MKLNDHHLIARPTLLSFSKAFNAWNWRWLLRRKNLLFYHFIIHFKPWQLDSDRHLWSIISKIKHRICIVSDKNKKTHLIFRAIHNPEIGSWNDDKWNFHVQKTAWRRGNLPHDAWECFVRPRKTSLLLFDLRYYYKFEIITIFTQKMARSGVLRALQVSLLHSGDCCWVFSAKSQGFQHGSKATKLVKNEIIIWLVKNSLHCEYFSSVFMNFHLVLREFKTCQSN